MHPPRLDLQHSRSVGGPIRQIQLVAVVGREDVGAVVQLLQQLVDGNRLILGCGGVAAGFQGIDVREEVFSQVGWLVHCLSFAVSRNHDHTGALYQNCDEKTTHVVAV